jgi:hypothetical protein
MKKILMTLLFGMFLLVPQQSHAQFFKQLGKIAENVGKDMWDGVTNGPFQVSAEKATSTIEDVTCTLQTAARKDSDLLFAATFQNEKDDDINLEFTNIRVVDTEGNSYNCSIAPNKNMELISGVPVKATITAHNVPATVKRLALVRIGTENSGKVEWRGVAF